jgi:cytochrome c oxidase subunit 1
MQSLDFTFLNNPVRRLSRYWLLLGATALALAGLFSLTLIISRSPGLSKLPFFVNLFHVSIVAHVDLSVLAWFLCIACMVWSLSIKKISLPMLEESALISMGLGIALIALAPFTGGEALMSNYIPVIMSPVFFFGLALIGCSVTLMAIGVLLTSPFRGEVARLRHALRMSLVERERVSSCAKITPSRPSATLPPLGGGTFSSALILLISLAAFYASYRMMPSIIDGEQYFELLFWGGGHVLQFLHVQILMVVWLFLVASAQCPVPSLLATRHSALGAIFLIGPIAALLTPLGYIHEVTSSEHHQFFTQTMIMAGGIAPAILALLLLPKIWRARGEHKGENRSLWSALVISILLFLYGGVLGGMIEGQNVVIPAHYHGSIIGITIAFMGFAYALLPAYSAIAAWRSGNSRTGSRLFTGQGSSCMSPDWRGAAVTACCAKRPAGSMRSRPASKSPWVLWASAA